MLFTEGLTAVLSFTISPTLIVSTIWIGGEMALSSTLAQKMSTIFHLFFSETRLTKKTKEESTPRRESSGAKTTTIFPSLKPLPLKMFLSVKLSKKWPRWQWKESLKTKSLCQLLWDLPKEPSLSLQVMTRKEDKLRCRTRLTASAEHWVRLIEYIKVTEIKRYTNDST